MVLRFEPSHTVAIAIVMLPLVPKISQSRNVNSRQNVAIG